jgi:hypothetical protein
VGAGVHLFYFATACFLAYLFAGHSGIYLSQRIGMAKYEGTPVQPDTPLHSAHKQ